MDKAPEPANPDADAAAQSKAQRLEQVRSILIGSQLRESASHMHELETRVQAQLAQLQDALETELANLRQTLGKVQEQQAQFHQANQGGLESLIASLQALQAQHYKDQHAFQARLEHSLTARVQTLSEAMQTQLEGLETQLQHHSQALTNLATNQQQLAAQLDSSHNRARAMSERLGQLPSTIREGNEALQNHLQTYWKRQHSEQQRQQAEQQRQHAEYQRNQQQLASALAELRSHYHQLQEHHASEQHSLRQHFAQQQQQVRDSSLSKAELAQLLNMLARQLSS